MDKDTGGLKKSYNLLVIWFISFLIFAITYGELVRRIDLDFNTKISLLLNFNLINLFIVSLFTMIYKTERVYYINYITYKEAVEATKEERKRFAYKHLRLFCIATIIFIIYSIISLKFQHLLFIDVIVYLVIVIITALRTVPYKLNKE